MDALHNKVEAADMDKSHQEPAVSVVDSQVATEVIEVDASYLTSSKFTKIYRGVFFQMVMYVYNIWFCFLGVVGTTLSFYIGTVVQPDAVEQQETQERILFANCLCLQVRCHFVCWTGNG